MATRERLRKSVERATRIDTQRQATSSRHVSHGQRSQNVRDRRMGTRSQSRQPVCRRWLAARNERRLQPGAHDHGFGVSFERIYRTTLLTILMRTLNIAMIGYG